MIRQKVKNFNIGLLNKTKVTASSGLILIMSFAKEIALAAALEKMLSHLKKRKKRSPAIEEEVAESVHFMGPEKGGKAYRFVVLRRKNNQLALFPDASEGLTNKQNIHCELFLLTSLLLQCFHLL